MVEQRKDQLRGVMKMAWAFYDAALRDGEDPPFSRCLASAWRMDRGFRQMGERLRGVTHLRLSPSLIRSPISRAHAGDPIREAAAARLTSVLGR